MKKLKSWQIVLLIIFYPIGIIYFIYWLCNKNKHTAENKQTNVARFDTSKAIVIKEFHTKVVGVTFKNDDGTSRQEHIKNCSIGEDAIFKPVPTDEFPNAIGVFTANGKQLGHLSEDVACELKNQYPTNPMSVTISNITGGGDYNYGCNIKITIYAIQTP